MQGVTCILAFLLSTLAVYGDEVPLSSLSRDDAKLYEGYLKEAVKSYNGIIVNNLYKRRYLDETTVEEGEDGLLYMRFYTRLMRCTLAMYVIQEPDGTEKVVVENKRYFNFMNPTCKPFALRRIARKAKKLIYQAESKVMREIKKLINNIVSGLKGLIFPTEDSLTETVLEPREEQRRRR